MSFFLFIFCKREIRRWGILPVSVLAPPIRWETLPVVVVFCRTKRLGGERERERARFSLSRTTGVSRTKINAWTVDVKSDDYDERKTSAPSKRRRVEPEHTWRRARDVCPEEHLLGRCLDVRTARQTDRCIFIRNETNQQRRCQYKKELLGWWIRGQTKLYYLKKLWNK